MSHHPVSDNITIKYETDDLASAVESTLKSNFSLVDHENTKY